MLLLALIVHLISAVQAGYDWDTGNAALWHSESAYCDPSSYLTRPQKGELAGFVPMYSINDTAHDTQGYIGYTDSQKAIWVAYRGSQSIENWATNLDAVMTDYPLCSDCDVHLGFYKAEQSVISQVISQVRALKNSKPNYSIVVTGHSLGAALGTLTALDLQHGMCLLESVSV